MRSKPRQFPDTSFPGCSPQIFDVSNAQIVIQDFDLARSETGNVENPVKARRHAFFEFFELAQLAGPNNFLDLFIEFLTYAVQPCQIRILGYQIDDRAGKTLDAPGGIAIGTHPERVGAFDLEKISRFLEQFGNVGVADFHGDMSGWVLTCGLNRP